MTDKITNLIGLEKITNLIELEKIFDKYCVKPPVDMVPERVVNEDLRPSDYINNCHRPDYIEFMCQAAEELGLQVLVFSGHFYWDDNGLRREVPNSDLKTIFVSLPMEGTPCLSSFWKLVKEKAGESE